MLHIGKSYIARVDGVSHLCADLTIGNRRTTLWFGVDSDQEEYLALGRADPFVMAMLSSAMRGGHEIVCEDPMSERLHYQLVNGLIPALSFAGELYHPIKITAPLTAEKLTNHGAVGTGFSGGADCLYTIMTHGRASEFPLTHIGVYNVGHVGQDRFQNLCWHARRFAEEQRLAIISVDSNICDILGERFNDAYSFRNYACALALGQLFSVYLLSSGHDAANFMLYLRNSAPFDLLTSRHVSTESLTFHHAGEEVKRIEKLAALSDWEPSWRWLHPCAWQSIDQGNCGHCKKCVRDMTTFYALGRLERYREVYDIEDYFQHLPQRLGSLFARSDGHLYSEAVQLLKERNIPIPPEAFRYERQHRLIVQHTQAEKQKGNW